MEKKDGFHIVCGNNRILLQWSCI